MTDLRQTFSFSVRAATIAMVVGGVFGVLVASAVSLEDILVYGFWGGGVSILLLTALAGAVIAGKQRGLAEALAFSVGAGIGLHVSTSRAIVESVGGGLWFAAVLAGLGALTVSPLFLIVRRALSSRTKPVGDAAA